MTLPAAAAAILAGGQARRFGGLDKSRLVVDGHSIIVRQLDILQRLTRDVFVVSGDAERFQDLGLPVHADCIPGLGAIGGIYTALEVATADQVLVVGCDQPFLDAPLLAELLRRTEGADGAWVRSARGVEPLVACYRRDARSAILREIRAGRLSPRDLGRVLAMAEIAGAELETFGSVDDLTANVNTPEDYARVQYRRR